MKRLVWLGPLLSVFFYASDVFGDEVSPGSQVDADASNHAVVSWQDSDWPIESTAELAWQDDSNWSDETD